MSKQGNKIQVPVGLEKALYHAARDEEFKAQLLADPAAAIESSGIRLRASEAAMLASISPDVIEMMIANLVPENPKRRKFMGLVAAAATSLAAGTAVISCDGASGDVLSKGATGDTDVDGDTDTTDGDAGSDAGDTDTVDTDTETDSTFGLSNDESIDGNFDEE
jgi:hypothetical protein